MTGAALGAIAICIAAASLEGVLSGRGVKNRLEQLRQPPYSPRLPAWIAVGIAYYVICCVVLTRLMHSAPSPLRWASLGIVVALLIGNALWNLAFFRFQDLQASTTILVIYAALAVILTILLGLVDSVSAWVFLPYLVYLIYATWWMLSLRRLNAPGLPPSEVSSPRPPGGR